MREVGWGSSANREDASSPGRGPQRECRAWSGSKHKCVFQSDGGDMDSRRRAEPEQRQRRSKCVGRRRSHVHSRAVGLGRLRQRGTWGSGEARRVTRPGLLWSQQSGHNTGRCESASGSAPGQARDYGSHHVTGLVLSSMKYSLTHVTGPLTRAELTAGQTPSQQRTEALLKLCAHGRRTRLLRGLGLRTAAGPVLPDDGQLGEGHRWQGQAIGEGDDFHCPGTFGCIALQALSHVFLF